MSAGVTLATPRRTGSPYEGRRGVLATMHGEDAVIAPPLRERPGLIVEVPQGLGTDSLGTFTGEIARADTIEEAAIAKAWLGVVASATSIGVASEGSYGPHPQIPFIEAGFELMVLVEDLDRALRDCAERSENGRAFAPADMRAHMNATRMAALGRLAERFANRLACQRPACHMPGYGPVGAEKGLPCAWCSGPVLMVRNQVFGCVPCDNTQRRALRRPDAGGSREMRRLQSMTASPSRLLRVGAAEAT